MSFNDRCLRCCSRVGQHSVSNDWSSESIPNKPGVDPDKDEQFTNIFLPPLYEMPNDFVFETTGILFFIAALRFCYLRLVFKMYLRDTRLFKTDFSLQSKQTDRTQQLVIARPTGIKLRKTLKGDMIKQVEINTPKKGITLFHWLQLSLVLIIFSLSIFGFN